MDSEMDFAISGYECTGASQKLPPSTTELDFREIPRSVLISAQGQKKSPDNTWKSKRKQSPESAPSPAGADDGNSNSCMIRQLETRPLTDEQLVAEVEGIYAGIVMVEKKISEVMAQQRISPRKLTDQQWQALVALHRTYIQEHHDYFLASQYYSAPPSLKEEASKQAMPARLWRHGIQNFLELLRRELPASLEHMLSFIALAYANMTLLRESVPRFEDTWVEYLGDLARHRMAISERPDGWKAWNAVATMWYQKAADISPGGGRIQRHLGVVARPNIIQQLFYHSKALVSAQPSPEARDSILHVVDLLPLPGEKCQHEKDLLDKDLYPTVETLCLPGETGCQHYPAAESALVKAAGLLASRGSITACDKLTDHFLSTLDEYIGRTKFRFRVQGVAIASTLCACLLDFGHTDSFLWKLLVHGQRQFDAVLEKLRRDSKRPIIEPQEISHLKGQQRRAYLDTTLSSTGHHKVRHPDPGRSIKNGQFSSSEDAVVRACHLFQLAVGLVLTRVSDKNILPFAHVILAFLVSLTYVPWALFYIEEHVPWASLVHFLNNVARSGVSDTRFEKPTFPQNHGGTGRQLPEDFMMRGLAWASNYHPDRFFEGDVVDEDERTLELPSHAGPRTERCLWLGVQLSLCGRWITYDLHSKQFATNDFATVSGERQEPPIGSRSPTISPEGTELPVSHP